MCVLFGACIPDAAADSYASYLACKARERLATAAGLTTSSQEKAVIATCYGLYKNQTLAFLGQPALAGMFPIADPSLGDSSLLTFQFIDPITGLPIDGPAIGSVLYEIKTEPNAPDVFQPLATSFDPFANFVLPFTLTDFEPDIQAVPFDLFGDPFVLIGEDGFNVAIGSVVNIPEGRGRAGNAHRARDRDPEFAWPDVVASAAGRWRHTREGRKTPLARGERLGTGDRRAATP